MRPNPSVEALESRRLFTTITFEGGLLHVTLNERPDRARVLLHPGTTTVDLIVRKEPFRQYDGVTSVRVEGLGGHDRIYLSPTLSLPVVMDGGPGRDALFGSHGDDVLDGGLGNDYIDGGGGNDRLIGGAHNDIIRGGDGNDTIDGGGGRDRIDGGAGNDVLTGGAARDVLTGGVGADTFAGLDRDREIRDLATEDLRTGA